MNRLLNALGLMTRAEHERLLHHKIFQPAVVTDWEAKFKKAVTDLAAQADEIKTLKVRLHYAEPRAQKWDDSLARSRARRNARSAG